MQPEQLEVDEKLLRSVAASVEGTASTLQAGVTAAGSGLAPAPQPGSAAADAARTVEKVWLAELGRVQRDVDAFADNLLEVAKGYQATDQASADGVRRAGNGASR